MTHTVNPTVPTRCAVCGQPLRPRRQPHGWQRHCSRRCANIARWGIRARLKRCYGLADDAALARWLVAQLQRREARAVAELCGLSRWGLYLWLRELGVRREGRGWHAPSAVE